MPLKRNAPIASWVSGDQVQGFALVSRRETRQDKNGKPFLDLELSDATGAIAAKVWGDSPAMDSEFAAFDFVAFRGSVKLYRDALQLSIDQCRKVIEADRQDGFDESLLIPSTREDIQDLWRRLTRIYRDEITRPVLQRLAREALEVHGPALKEHPAAKAMHHAYRGGLLEHVVSMAELALAVTGHYRDLDRDLILLGVLFHDLGKIRELGAMPANDYTPEGRLVGHVVIGRDLLLAATAAIADFPPDLRLHLEHLVLSHQGKREFAAVVEPMTAEALVLHFIDDLDAKLNQLRIAKERGQGLQFMKGLGRYFYLDGLTAPPEADGAPVAEEDLGPAPEEVELEPQTRLF
ncbi:MAG TPA: HD domain-containing protein [Thermoanaerobaculia bacterium]|nr:HD domain-containing protein [Thermoanaerobaculia bacterium]